MGQLLVLSFSKAAACTLLISARFFSPVFTLFFHMLPSALDQDGSSYRRDNGVFSTDMAHYYQAAQVALKLEPPQELPQGASEMSLHGCVQLVLLLLPFTIPSTETIE
eukprot:TRINITY_DN2030_c0_g1_i1.p1 TRINITY_DN2030_c0_g1~~TRINITY_DN2030_c0_g1_i1.p1  ORF type:complete len:108 (+),score=5.52 TRINITY_DN2030_c0_g1_i1:228-551(+)